MDNREKLNNAIEKDINKYKYYSNIKKRIDKRTTKKCVFGKWSLVPICLVLLISMMIYNIGDMNKELKVNDDYIRINSISSNKTNNEIFGSDHDLSYGQNVDDLGTAIELNYTKLINEQKFLKNLILPDEFINHRFLRQYDVRENFIGYTLYYWNYDFLTEYDRNGFIFKGINIHFSNASDFHPDEKLKNILSKIEYSSINNTKVAIWQYTDKRYYNVFFEYNDLCFEMRTLNVSKDDLLNILSSLMNNNDNNNQFQNNTEIDNREIIEFGIKNKPVLEQIVDEIKRSFDKSFDKKDYSLSVTNGPDGTIYDFNYMYGDVKTLHGYTAMVENNSIEIYNNMGDIKEKIKNINDNSHIIDINDQKK